MPCPNAFSTASLAPSAGTDSTCFACCCSSVLRSKKVVHWMPEILFAAEIAFRRLDRCMPQQELNLLQLAAIAVAQLRTGSPQVVRCNMLQTRSLAAGLDYVPHNMGREERKKRSSTTRKYRCLLQQRGAGGVVGLSCDIRSYRIACRIKLWPACLLLGHSLGRLPSVAMLEQSQDPSKRRSPGNTSCQGPIAQRGHQPQPLFYTTSLLP